MTVQVLELQQLQKLLGLLKLLPGRTKVLQQLGRVVSALVRSCTSLFGNPGVEVRAQKRSNLSGELLEQIERDIMTAGQNVKLAPTEYTCLVLGALAEFPGYAVFGRHLCHTCALRTPHAARSPTFATRH